MSIRARVEDALFLYHNSRYEGAFLNVLIAVAATAKCEYPNLKDGEGFEKFLDKNLKMVLKVEFRGELHSMAHVIYKWFRCELVHEGGLPIDVQFIKEDALRLRAGGAPEYILKISLGWFNWLITSVVKSPCNKKDFQDWSF